MPLTPKQSQKVLMQKVNKTLKNLRVGEKSTVKSVLGDLRKVRIDISETLKGVERFEMPYFRAMMDEIDEKIATFTSRMQDTVGDAQGVSFASGADLSDDIFKTVGLSFGTVGISDELIATSKVFSADLITDMSDEMRKDISRSIRKGLLTGETNFQVARNIDKIIGIKKKTGYLNRSDKIARMEINRAFSIARQAKDEQVVEQVPEMKQQWITSLSNRVRPAPGVHPSLLKWNHRAAHGQIRKVNEPFDVSGEKLLYPRDQSLGASAENVIGCECQVVPYMEEWEKA